MIKVRSKSKIKHSVTFAKKQIDDKGKGSSKDCIKKHEDKENNGGTSKLSMTVTVQSKKKLKHSGQSSSRAVSPLCFKKKNEQKNDDEKFIQKLFSQTHQSKQKSSKNFLVQKLIQGLVPEQQAHTNSKNHQNSHYQSTDISKQLHIKNQQVITLQQQIQQLKLYISNFTFKVFDLTVLCRKYCSCVGNEEENIQFSRKTDQVIAYLDCLVRHWRLQQKIKLHCEGISKKMISSSRPKHEQSRKRCHTQSLKIPIQDYLQSLQSTAQQNIHLNLNLNLRKQQQKNGRKSQIVSNNKNCEQQTDENSEIMKILSRRSSGVKKEEEQTYVVIKSFTAKSEHQLNLKAGDRVTVLQKNNTERWLGFKQGKIGYFSKNCLF